MNTDWPLLVFKKENRIGQRNALSHLLGGWDSRIITARKVDA
jgi:hypothetical protein